MVLVICGPDLHVEGLKTGPCAFVGFSQPAWFPACQQLCIFWRSSPQSTRGGNHLLCSALLCACMPAFQNLALVRFLIGGEWEVPSGGGQDDPGGGWNVFGLLG